MSQIHIPSSSQPPPPEVPTDFQTDNGTATPIANVLIVHGLDSSENNDNGITVKGGVAGTGTANEMDIVLTNRITGSVTTTDATETPLIDLPMGATPGVYIVTGDLSAFNVTDSAGASYTFAGSAITDGVTGTEIGSEIRNTFEQAAMAAADFDYGIIGNNAVLAVQGIAGKTIKWNCLFTYRFVS